MKPRPVRLDQYRRRLLASAGGVAALSTPLGALGALGGTAELGFAELPDGTLAEQVLYALPGKSPLIKKSYRPPNFETPIQYFRTPITSSRAFFVRWHLAAIPEVRAAEWKLTVGGDAAGGELAFTLEEIKKAFR